MKKSNVLILGGYGGVGKSLARLMLKETDVELIIAGRREEKAREFAGVLSKEYSGNRVTSRYADASDSSSMAAAFREVDILMITGKP
ncbi:MAG: KR domain-containing protein [Desulfobacteraceae bacterium]|nr:KR domain-containing protein [Desulfobacteraceae bacterium]